MTTAIYKQNNLNSNLWDSQQKGSVLLKSYFSSLWCFEISLLKFFTKHKSFLCCSKLFIFVQRQKLLLLQFSICSIFFFFFHDKQNLTKYNNTKKNNNMKTKSQRSKYKSKEERIIDKFDFFIYFLWWLFVLQKSLAMTPLNVKVLSLHRRTKGINEKQWKKSSFFIGGKINNNGKASQENGRKML